MSIEMRRGYLPARIPLTRCRIVEGAEPGLAEHLDPGASHAVVEQKVVAPVAVQVRRGKGPPWIPATGGVALEAASAIHETLHPGTRGDVVDEKAAQVVTIT